MPSLGLVSPSREAVRLSDRRFEHCFESSYQRKYYPKASEVAITADRIEDKDEKKQNGEAMTDFGEMTAPTEDNDQDGTMQAALDGPTSASTTAVKAEAESSAAVSGLSSTVKVPAASGTDVDLDGDSEAETLIQSPEKKRSIMDNAPTLHPTITAAARGPDANMAVAPESDKKSKKRKRNPEDAEYETSSRASSPQSSPLSSPNIHAQANDSDSDTSRRSAPRSGQSQRTRRGLGTGDADDGNVSSKIKKRRPSDLLPPAIKQRSRGSVDGGIPERRETRSATYPRHSSDERSTSPQLPLRKEHRRGMSTQLVQGEFERKKRGRPPNLNTRRNKSADRARSSSSDSDSPPRNRPSLHKFNSHDHDDMSPVKAPGTRKFRDKNGRTFLSRACNNDDLERAKISLKERPGDLDMPDNAGNTPLQIAALEGFIDIVRFLLESDANVDTQNIDKDTPLIDAVENGHIDVVKLLLDHGANPRLGNAKGEEPYELINADAKGYKVIRKMIANAKEHDYTKRRRSGDKHEDLDETSSKAASAPSPRDSPGPVLGPRSPPAATSRRRTGRSESTRNDLLWQASTQENLKRMSSKGDVQGVAQVLNVLGKAEPISLIAAAKAGHHDVMNLLLSLGDADPDPPSVEGQLDGYDTPILAAIGRGNLEGIRLLLEQSKFDPTRKYNKKTYYQIAAERKGLYWSKEFEILKEAYDKYTGDKPRKASSPRKSRDQERLKDRAIRKSSSPVSSNLRNSSSPTMTHRSLPGKSPRSVPKEGKTSLLSDRKRISDFGKEVDDTVAIASDQDQTISDRKSHKHRRSQSDANIGPDMEVEPTQRRRRLVTGKDFHKTGRQGSTSRATDEEASKLEVERESHTPGLKRGRDSISPSLENAKDLDARLHVKKRRTVLESSPEESRPGPKPKGPKPRGTRHTEMEDATQILTEVNDVFKQHSRQNSEKANQSKPTFEEHEAVTSTSQADPSSDTLPTDALIKPDSDEFGAVPAPTVEDDPAEVERRALEEKERAAIEEKKAEEDMFAALKAAEDKRAAVEAALKRQAEEEAMAHKQEEEQRQELVRRELEDRQRQQEEQIRQQHLEIERWRRESLPAALCKSAFLIDTDDPSHKSHEWLSRFLPLYTVRTKQFDYNATSADPEDEWVPNFQVASLLATKDLKLSNFTTCEKRAATTLERDRLWKVARQMLSYDYATTKFNTSIKQACVIEEQQMPKFNAMPDVFWVRLSDFEDQASRTPYLSGLDLKKQPVTLRVVILGGPVAPVSPVVNGIHHTPAKLSNGFSPYLSTPFMNGGPRS